MLISNDMGIFCKIKRYFEDLWAKICQCRWKALLCAVIAIAGVGVGVAFCKAFQYSWWHYNRLAFSETLFIGGFSLFFFFLITALAYYVCIVLCNMLPQTRFLVFVLLFVAGFYCGANAMACIESWSVWGVFFALLVTLPEILACTTASFLAYCEYPAYRRFKESWCDFRPCLVVLAMGLVVRIITFYVILKILTAVI